MTAAAVINGAKVPLTPSPFMRREEPQAPDWKSMRAAFQAMAKRKKAKPRG